MRVLICGGGVIGASIAYFLSLKGAEPIVIERSGLACAASGKAGGFLALDWCDGTPLQGLARRSFELHDEFAKTLEADWGYRRLTTYSGVADGQAGRGRYSLDWLAPGVHLDRRLGTPETTAQVHPRQFTKAIMDAAVARGAKLRIGTVEGVLGAKEGRATGVEVDGEPLAGDAVVIAMGPWSILASAWVPLPAIFGSKGHSIVYSTGNHMTADALFLEAAEATGEQRSPEIYPRPDGTAWVCGISSSSPLPLDPNDVHPDPGAIERLAGLSAALSPVLDRSKILKRQACFRPVTQDGLPIIGPVAGIEGAYVATGHSVWGILNGPATGEALAELICDGTSSLDLSPFSPNRLPLFDAKGLQATALQAR